MNPHRVHLLECLLVPTSTVMSLEGVNPHIVRLVAHKHCAVRQRSVCIHSSDVRALRSWLRRRSDGGLRWGETCPAMQCSAVRCSEHKVAFKDEKMTR